MKRLLIAIIAIFLVNGCGSEESSEIPVDIATYLPSNNLNKQYTDVKKLNGELNNNVYTHSIVVEPNLITTKRAELLESIISISDDEINFLTIDDINKSKIYKRKVYIGDEVSNYISSNESKPLVIGSQRVGETSTRVEERCVFDTKLDTYEVYFYEYKNYDGSHDIIKLKCTSKRTVSTIVDAQYVDTVLFENGTVVSKENISYRYFQKGLGVIATIDDDCIVSKSPDVIDDTADKSKCIGDQYHRVFYHLEY